jgi:protein-S-isoprenylcysteine O-methyltransferase Ste14
VALQEEMEQQGQFLFRYRSYLPLAILVIGLAVYIYYQLHLPSDINLNRMIWFERICVGVSLLGLLVRVYTIGHIAKNTSGRNTSAGQIADDLNTKGIYSIVRHPLYVGNFIMWLGIAMLTANIWFVTAFVFMYWVYYERIMFAEEQFLRRKFGEPYINWSMKTPAFVPSFKNWEKPYYGFNMKKVLRQEKNGLVAVFLVVFLFQQVAVYLQSHAFEIRDKFVLGGLLVTTLYYVVIKTIQKTTKWLESDR